MMNIFNLWLWLDWVYRSIFCLGLLAFFLFVGMQVFGWEITIGLPTIEHTFKHK